MDRERPQEANTSHILIFREASLNRKTLMTETTAADERDRVDLA